MNRLIKAAIVFLLLAIMPLKQWAQTPYRQYSNNGVELNFSTIDDVYFRAYLLYNLSQDNRFVLTAEEDNGIFYIGSSDESLDEGCVCHVRLQRLDVDVGRSRSAFLPLPSSPRSSRCTPPLVLPFARLQVVD